MPRLTKAEMQEMINQALEKAREDGRRRAEQGPIDAYKATERRLYALPDLREKLVLDEQELRSGEIQEPEIRGRSHDIVRFKTSSCVLTTEEIIEAVTQDLKAKIARTRREIAVLESALASIADDDYYLTVEGRYIQGLSDEDIAKTLCADQSTIRRNRGRLVHKMAVRLYGVDAV